MEYICKNAHIFLHPAKIMSTIPTRICEVPLSADATVELSVCPVCQSIIYRENKHEQRITSVISVDLDDVDAKLAEGYVVEALYAKTATLVKKTAVEG